MKRSSIVIPTVIFVRKEDLKGIFPPHVTPFTKDGDLDLDALRKCVDFWIEGGVSGLVTCGSNGEAPYLSREERKKVIETVIDQANDRVPVIVGTGSISTRETIQLTKDAEDLGADAALVVTPFYFKHTNEEIYQHYKTVAEAVDLSIILYNVPKFTGFSLDPIVVKRVVEECENVIGIKDSSGSVALISEMIRLVGDRISVLAGSADVFLPTLMLGGKGAIIAVAIFAPKLCRELYEQFLTRNYERAAELQNTISFFNSMIVRKLNQLAAVKYALIVQGVPAGYPRRPTLPLGKEEMREVEEVLKEAGIIG